MVANDWLMQFLADIQNAPVDRPEVMETTALGAAFLAGVKAGVFSSIEDITRVRRTQRKFCPEMPTADRDRLRGEWRKALRQTLAA
jgi:glycerol kinase